MLSFSGRDSECSPGLVCKFKWESQYDNNKKTLRTFKFSEDVLTQNSIALPGKTKLQLKHKSRFTNIFNHAAKISGSPPKHHVLAFLPPSVLPTPTYLQAGILPQNENHNQSAPVFFFGSV